MFNKQVVKRVLSDWVFIITLEEYQTRFYLDKISENLNAIAVFCAVWLFIGIAIIRIKFKL